MKKYEFFTTEQKLIEGIKEYRNAGYNDRDLEIISRERIEGDYVDCVDCNKLRRDDLDRDRTDSEKPSLGDRIIAFFTGDNPDDRSFVNLDIKDDRRVDVENAVRNGQYVLVINDSDNFDDQDLIDGRNERVLDGDREYQDNILTDERIIKEDRQRDDINLLDERTSYVDSDPPLYEEEAIIKDADKILEDDNREDKGLIDGDPIYEDDGPIIRDRGGSEREQLNRENAPLEEDPLIREENFEKEDSKLQDDIYEGNEEIIQKNTDNKPKETDHMGEEAYAYLDDVDRHENEDRQRNIDNRQREARDRQRDLDIEKEKTFEESQETIREKTLDESDRIGTDEDFEKVKSGNPEDALYEVYGRDETPNDRGVPLFDEVDQVIDRETETEDGNDPEYDEVDPLYVETVLDKNDPMKDSSRLDEDEVFQGEEDSDIIENDLDRRHDYRKKNIEDIENTPVTPRRNYDDDTNI